MKNLHSIKPILIIFLCIAVVGLPILSYAQDPARDAQLAAEENTSKILWFGAGFLGGIIGVILAYVIKPSPPASTLVGKSPDYVAAYTDAYREECKSIQTKYAWIGCGTQSVLTLICYLAGLLTTASAY